MGKCITASNGKDIQVAKTPPKSKTTAQIAQTQSMILNGTKSRQLLVEKIYPKFSFELQF